jgi:hypothetical protein
MDDIQRFERSKSRFKIGGIKNKRTLRAFSA